MKKQKRLVPKLVRIIYAPIQASGRRESWARHVERINPYSSTNGFAFNGPRLTPYVETDLPVGAVVVQRTPTGSANHNNACWELGHVTKHGLVFKKEQWEHKNFLSFRDAVADELAQHTDPFHTVSEEIRRCLDIRNESLSQDTLEDLARLIIKVPTVIPKKARR